MANGLISRRGVTLAIMGSGLAPARLSAGKSLSFGGTSMKIAARFAGHALTIALDDNPTALDLRHQREDRLPSADVDGRRRGHFGKEAPGDFAYFAQWGNLVFYYAGYRYANGLIRLGRIEGSFEGLRTRGDFPLRLEQAA